MAQRTRNKIARSTQAALRVLRSTPPPPFLQFQEPSSRVEES